MRVAFVEDEAGDDDPVSYENGKIVAVEWDAPLPAEFWEDAHELIAPAVAADMKRQSDELRGRNENYREDVLQQVTPSNHGPSLDAERAVASALVAYVSGAVDQCAG
uniref:Uncharacterized protein n=1 Tax=Sexangularia sp. CB-2014 TaxID=1486929 RepID=A0A7S1YBQ9_9EUKA|mmetsp:Transcript_12239/g.38783  ORF Transcript_12239/g.38783 Transcript_12239/m.38783 type:complete len:107 (+) Transcript_12239:149-469(+)